MVSPIQPTDAQARALAQKLMADAVVGALAVNDPQSEFPFVSRVALCFDDGGALLLVSALSHHTKALEADPTAALLIGEPGPKGDPLTYPRMTLQGRTVPADKNSHRTGWLRTHPKSALYYDFGDFRMLRLDPERIFLNGGFGKAYELTPDDVKTGTGP